MTTREQGLQEAYHVGGLARESSKQRMVRRLPFQAPRGASGSRPAECESRCFLHPPRISLAACASTHAGRPYWWVNPSDRSHTQDFGAAGREPPWASRASRFRELESTTGPGILYPGTRFASVGARTAASAHATEPPLPRPLTLPSPLCRSGGFPQGSAYRWERCGLCSRRVGGLVDARVMSRRSIGHLQRRE